MPPRRRLNPADRRAQLLAVGARLFAASPYDDVLMEDVAREAGVSRALLYQHFPSKHALFAAVYQQAAEQLLVATRFEPGASLVEQLTQGLDAHLDYFVANRHAVLAANRVLAGDPVIQTIMTDELDALRSRLLGVLPLADERVRDAVSAALKAWLVFVQVLCVDWLTRETCTRTELRDTCVGAAVGALRPLLSEDPAAGRPPAPA
ncbi:TetR family transcriptional regulator [Streptomyces sp. KhCrAH-43]|uniref:TetR/AcrR family transcriptional regulator n=1 Tax=Streptomyces TaxID=1883 RepID=UPI000370AD63|nr:TetR/AcrR family transcriptional regulator [Streptomyces sp. KhCrAH-43]MYS36468.1 TetR family transcriptional regulator [Streptomyces sp. SID4920]MYX69985.1 TetR family transcriptional regulator [Streptomyces sp. SID8373]RAJ52326.1 TetR family transcriptional regulator [Streptomyces sp. KhCrAH-43]